jgi:XTP/dITP diphosphohydrolase
MTPRVKRLFQPTVNTIISDDSHVPSDSHTSLIIATGNQDKINEYSRIVGLPVEGINLKIPEVQSEDPLVVLKQKAIDAWRRNNGNPIVVEDSALLCKGIEGLPGPFADQFTNTLSKRNALCRMLDGQDRSAVFQVGIALFDGKEVHHRIGRITGTIAEKPAGTEGFGFDDIFIPDSQKNGRAKPLHKTYAQMSLQEKDTYSPRQLALKALLQEPFDVKKYVYELPEPYPLQLVSLRTENLAKNKKALKFAYQLEQFKTAVPDSDFIPNSRKPYIELKLAGGHISQYVTDKDSASVGLLLTQWDTAKDLSGNPKRLNINEFGQPRFWQMGDGGTKMALASRAYEFAMNHNEEMYTYLRAMMQGKIETTKRPKKRSAVIEKMLKMHKRLPADTDLREDTEILGTAANRELGYARMSSEEYMSRTVSANKGLILNSAGFPSSLFALGGMPPVTGWRDVIVTAALSYMRSYIPRNSVFAGNLERQLKLFDQSRSVIEVLALPKDIQALVLRQIGIAVGVENPKAIAAIAKEIMKHGCTSMRIYTTNPDPRVIETAQAIRQSAGKEMTICVGPIVDGRQAKKLVQSDIAVNVLLAGHGGGENCTSLAGGGTANSLELLYEMYSDPVFDNTAIGLEGGTGDEIGALLGLLDVISLNRRGIAGGIETGGLFVEHVNGRAVQPYHGSASSVTQWIEAALQPSISMKRLNDAGRLKNVEGVLNYIMKKHSTHSIVELFWERRMFAGRALADQAAKDLYDLRRKIAIRGHQNHRSVTMEAAYIAAAHRVL